MSNHPFRPLRHRAVRRIWSAGMFSDIGTWVQLVVVGSLVAQESGSALKTGLVAMATIVPPGICAPIGGLLADRLDRRKVFITGLLCQGIVTAGLALALGAGVRNPAVLSLIILCSSAVGSLANPAYSAMLPDLVPHDELMPMVALGVYSWNAGRIIGPLLATVVGAAVGPTWTVTFNAITFGAMALAVSSVRQQFLPPNTGDESGIGARLAEGYRALRVNPGCRAATMIVIVLNVTIAAFMGLVPIFAKAAFGGGTRLAGTISSAQGAGAIIGSIVIAAVANRLSRSSLMFILVPLLFVSYVGYALAPSATWAVVAVVGLGCGASGLFVAAMSVAQRDAPEAQRGRVLSLVQAAMGTSYGVGVLWIAFLGDAFSLRLAFVVAACAMVVAAVGLTRLDRNWRSVLDGTHPERSRPVGLDDALGTATAS